jgi:hypothetical protein
MKKLLLLALTAMMMVGCDHNKLYKLHDYGIQTIDSCEYVIGYCKLSHKGNCKYCAERRKQELKELVKQLKDK